MMGTGREMTPCPKWFLVARPPMVASGIPFPMLTDTGGKIGTVYGVYDESAGVDIAAASSSTRTG